MNRWQEFKTLLKKCERQIIDGFLTVRRLVQTQVVIILNPVDFIVFLRLLSLFSTFRR